MKQVLTLLSILAWLFESPALSAKQIALTFDDAPRPDTSYFSSIERNTMMLQTLKKQQVTAMFFVTTRHIGDGREQRLLDYAKYQQLLGNHSHSHPSANRTKVSDFISDVETADNILKEYPHYHPYFRFPYLHHGNTQTKRDAIRSGLSQLGLKQGYVTVDNYDWYLDSLLQQAAQAQVNIPLDKWRKVYLEHLLTSVNFYHDMALEYLGHSPKHVLLLHENDLAALFVGDLIEALRTHGWEIISPLEAYQDDIATTLPKTLFNGQGRVAALAAEKGVSPQKLRQVSENEKTLKKQLMDLSLLSK